MSFFLHFSLLYLYLSRLGAEIHCIQALIDDSVTYNLSSKQVFSKNQRNKAMLGAQSNQNKQSGVNKERTNEQRAYMYYAYLYI